MSEPKPSIAVRLLSRLASSLYRRRWLYVWPQLLLAFACVWITVFRLEFDTDRNALVGSEKEYHRNFLRFKAEFPAQDDLVAMLDCMYWPLCVPPHPASACAIRRPTRRR